MGAPALDPALLDGLVRLRRDLHAHPELRSEEHRTAGIAAERLAALGLDVHRGLGGERAAEGPTPPNMTSEDFGFMLERQPGAHGLIGTATPGRPSPALHAPTYDVEDAAIPFGVA